MPPRPTGYGLRLLRELAVISNAPDRASFLDRLTEVVRRLYDADLSLAASAHNEHVSAATGFGESWLVLHIPREDAGDEEFEHIQTAALFVGGALARFNETESADPRLQSLRELAGTDALTGVANRRTFDEALDALWHSTALRGETLTLLLIDVDFFGAYNERYGHPAGDEALKIVASAIARHVRAGDTIARYGGEEFAVILRDFEPAAALALAERVLHAIEEAGLEHRSTTLGTVSVSAGCLTWTASGRRGGPRELLSDVDDLLYRAKREGRNRVAAPGYTCARSATARRYDNRSYLPAFVGRFVGRTATLQRAAQLFETGTLVTFVGSGGVGKTRLACEIAARLDDRYEHGASFVELMSCASAEAMLSKLAHALNLRVPEERPIIDAIVEALYDQHRLLILDNCEHLMAECRAFAGRVLSECKRVNVLATSREPLGLEGERLVRVSPLNREDAVALFRARTKDDADASEPSDDAAVATLCDRIDRLPLAIELVASRAIEYGSSFDRLLDEPLGLAAGTRTQHETLADVVSWSYNLLTEPEQQSFRALSIFRGGFSPDDAAEIAGLNEEKAAETLRALTEKSLLSQDPHTGLYRLPEISRTFTAEQLQRSGQFARVERAYVRRYAGIARESHDRLHGGVVERTIADLPANVYFEVLHAIQRAYASGDISGATEIVADLGLLWELTGRFHDALRCLNQIRPHINELQPILQGRFYYASACVAHSMANHAVMEEDAVRAVEIFRKNDELWAAHAQRLVATALLMRGDADAAEPLYMESLETFRRAGHVRGERAALINLGVIAMDWRCDYERARIFFEEALAAKMPDWYTSAIAHMNLSEALYRTGQLAQAVEQARCARNEMPTSGTLLYSIACTALGEYLVESGDVWESCAILREAIAIESLRQNPKYFSNALEAIASLCIALNDRSSAAFLIAYVERYRAQHAVEPTKASEAKRLAMSSDAASAADAQLQYARAMAAEHAEIVSECEFLLSTVSTGTHRAVQTQTC